MQPFTAAAHHDVLVLLVQVAVLLLTARLLGEAAQRLGQPSVVGEILAGILLGPSCISAVAPALGQWLMPQTKVQGYLLELIGTLGAMFLLVITGLETDLPLIRRHARAALGAAAGGIVVPFFAGLILGWMLPDALLAGSDRRLVFALFVATALSISAIPVIGKVLLDMNLMRRDIGQTIIAAGMTDDTVGWMLLSIVAGLAGGEAVSAAAVGRAVGWVVGFMIVSFTAGRWLVHRALDLVQDRMGSPHRLLTVVIVFVFAWGAVAQALRLEAVLGAFVMGILFGQMPRLPERVHEELHALALGIFAPLFFGVAGLKVNVVRLFHPALLVIAAAVIAVAVLGKVVGAYAGARLVGRRDHWTALSFGAGLNARGAMEIIVATIGLGLGILGQDMFSIIVLMAMSTSLMAPAGLRWTLRHITPEEQELKRLRQEELAAGSLIGSVRRILLPMRVRRDAAGAVHSVEAQLLQRFGGQAEVSITLLSVVPPGQRAEGTAFLEVVAPLFGASEIVAKVVESQQPSDIILDEAQKDYQLLVLGASERSSRSDVLFSPLTDYLVRVAPCTTLVVRGGRYQPDWSPQRILVPTNGTVTARRAAEVAFAMAPPATAHITVLNVVEERRRYRADLDQGTLERRLGRGYQIVQELCAVGESVGLRTRAEVRVGSDPEQVILELARAAQMDLIIVGTNLRPGSDRLFLGPSVERVLYNAPCSVVVVNTA